MYTGPFIAEYQSIENKPSFHLMYSMVFYTLWFVSGEGKSRTRLQSGRDDAKKHVFNKFLD